MIRKKYSFKNGGDPSPAYSSSQIDYPSLKNNNYYIENNNLDQEYINKINWTFSTRSNYYLNFNSKIILPHINLDTLDTYFCHKKNKFTPEDIKTMKGWLADNEMPVIHDEYLNDIFKKMCDKDPDGVVVAGKLHKCHKQNTKQFKRKTKRRSTKKIRK